MTANIKRLLGVIVMMCTMSMVAHADKPSSKSDGVIEMLREFYISYIKERSKATPNIEVTDRMLSKYCTGALINRLNTFDWATDPFLNSTKCEESWVKNLSVEKLAGDGNYRIGYRMRTGKEVNVELRVIHDGSKYRIHDLKMLP
ncbi:hypothetical protein [Porphyromonas pogonae]|uniref:hypothetical protein n=1 Tax=Porphyromonas pogonae TaxID=867595 RepID=UPI002E78803A|nr:hypothetical protein [Porphyromonas pogonae]